MASEAKSQSLRDLVGQLRQSGQVARGVTMSPERVTHADASRARPRDTPRPWPRAGTPPASRYRSLPAEQGRPGPDRGLSR